MIAVIVPPGPSSQMHGLDAQQSLALLPLGDRPILQHIIESLATQGITSIEVITGHAPEKIEALLGNGDRWGCNFRYHLAAQADRPYRSLRVIAETRTEPWMLIHAERFPCVTFPTGPVTDTALYCGVPGSNSHGDSGPSIVDGSNMDSWGGTAIFPAGDLCELLWDKTFDELRGHLQQMLSSGESSAIATSDWIDASTPKALLDSQARLLAGRLNGLMISGIERQPGIWVSRNVEIHPSAKLTAPLYIGPNCRINRGVKLGPDVVIGGDCIVDSNTAIDHSLAMAGSYIGEGLELSDAIVNHNLLVNVRLGTRINIAESFLLGGLEQKHRQTFLERGIQSVVAAFLIILFIPISLLSILYFAAVRHFSYTSVEMAKIPEELGAASSSSFPLPCLGADAWKIHRPAGWSAFTRQFLPGLFSAVVGRISLVGLPPRTNDEIRQLSPEWRALYQRGRAGLITECSVAATHEGDEMQFYLADAYYSARRNWLHDLKLGLQYMLRLIVPMRGR